MDLSGPEVAAKVEAQEDVCIGSGQCQVMAPSVFSLGALGKVSVRGDGEVAESELDAVENAVALCPVEALLLHRRT